MLYSIVLLEYTSGRRPDLFQTHHPITTTVLPLALVKHLALVKQHQKLFLQRDHQDSRGSRVLYLWIRQNGGN
jgi:hypothetical protein